MRRHAGSAPRPALRRGWISLVALALVVGWVLIRPGFVSRIIPPRPTSTEQVPDNATIDPARLDTLPAGENPSVAGPLGQLRKVDRGIRISTAGLRYAGGGPEGDRLQHVLRHDEDMPDRAGPHGVFDGGPEEALAAIDEAYLMVLADSPRAKTRREGPRSIHEVDLGRRVGYVGGQTGQRMGHPEARYIRLVLEGSDVITAFPFRP